MIFSYNVNSRLNFTFNFSRLRADGFYNRQNLIHNYLSATSHYSSKNHRYSLLFSAIYNGVDVAENGGIIDDSAFIYSKSILDRKLFDVNLDLAKNKIRNKNFRITQFFNFGKSILINDSVKSVNAISRISLTTEFDDKLFEFRDEMEFGINEDGTLAKTRMYFDRNVKNQKISIENVPLQLENWLQNITSNYIGFHPDNSHSEIKLTELYRCYTNLQDENIHNNTFIAARSNLDSTALQEIFQKHS